MPANRSIRVCRGSRHAAWQRRFDSQGSREGPAGSKCLQTITTYTYSSTKAASSKWLQGLLVRSACKQVHQSIQRLQACWQAKRALIVKQPGKGLHVRNGCIQSLHVHIQVQRLQVRNGCRFEMAAAGPGRAPEPPDTTTNAYSCTSRRTSTTTSTCRDPARTATQTELLLESHYEHLQMLPCTCTTVPAAPEVHLYHLDGEVNAEGPAEGCTRL